MEIESFGVSVKPHFKAARSAVLYRVVQGFLQNSEQARGGFARQFLRDVAVAKVDFDSVLLRAYAAEAIYRCDNPEVLEFRGM